MDLRNSGWESMEWIQLAQDRGRCEYDDEPSGSGAMDLVLKFRRLRWTEYDRIGEANALIIVCCVHHCLLRRWQSTIAVEAWKKVVSTGGC
jgi:hypothetical protein